MARWKHIIWFACMCTSQQSNFSQSYNIPWSIPLPLHISVLKAHNNLQHQHNLPRHADFIISNDFVPTLLIFFPCTFHILFKVWQNIKYSFSCCHISKKQWAIPDFSLINKEDAIDHSTWKKLIKNVWQRAIKRLCVCVFPDQSNSPTFSSLPWPVGTLFSDRPSSRDSEEQSNGFTHHTVGFDVTNLVWTNNLQVWHFVLDAAIIQVVQTTNLLRIHCHDQLQTHTETVYRRCKVVSATFKCPSATFSTLVHHIWMWHEQPCFICFTVWPTTSLKYDF